MKYILYTHRYNIRMYVCICTIPTAHMLVRVAIVETAEGGEVSHI